MRHLAWINLAFRAALILLAAGCSAAYPYLPATGRGAAPSGTPGAAGATAAGQTPLPGSQYAAPPVEPQPDLAQRLQAPEAREAQTLLKER